MIKNETVINEDIRETENNFLQELFLSKDSAHIFLVNGIRLTGTIKQYDKFVILLDGPSQQIVYKHAVSTILRG
jgi:RNA chaperone Hfq